MKGWMIAFGTFAGAVYIFVLATADAAPSDFVWGVVLGIAIGLVLGATTHFLVARPWHWRVRVKSTYGGKAAVVLRRLNTEINVAELHANADDFDDRLHEATAQARHKAAAMEAVR